MAVSIATAESQLRPLIETLTAAPAPDGASLRDLGSEPSLAPVTRPWGPRTANLRDPFGHVWTFATRKEDLTPAQMQERARAAGKA